MRSPVLSLLLMGALALSTLEYRAVDAIQGRNLSAQVEVAGAIIAGHPYWKAYQNRLLGPVVVGGVTRWLHLPGRAVYQGFCFAALWVANVTGAVLFRSQRRAGARMEWGFVVAYAGLFVAFQDPEWLYLWDYVDLTTMLLFAWAAVLGTWKLWQWVLLFLVELANRESAQFIALWLVLDSWRPGSVGAGGGWRRRVHWARLGVGLGLGIGGTLWTQFIRDALCRGETGVLPRPEIVEFASGQFFMGRVTLELLGDPWNLAAAALGLLLAALGFLLGRTWRGLGTRAWPLAALLSAMVAANLLLSFIYELRVWFALLPFAVCLAHRWQQELAGEAGGADEEQGPSLPPVATARGSGR